MGIDFVKLGELGAVVVLAVALVVVVGIGAYLVKIVASAVNRGIISIVNMTSAVRDSVNESKETRESILEHLKGESSKSEKRHQEVMASVTEIRHDFLSELPRDERRRHLGEIG